MNHPLDSLPNHTESSIGAKGLFSTWLLLAPVMLLCEFLHALPRPVFQVAGAGLGRLLHAIHFRRKIVAGNLQLALGNDLNPASQASLARHFYRHLGFTFLDIARNFALNTDEMRRELVLEERDRNKIQEILGKGKGIVFVSAHIANWELLAMGMAAHGFPAAVVVKRMSSAASQALIERQRKKTGLEIIYSGGTIEKMKAALSKGKIVGFMMDQNITGKKGIRCNFFGVPASSIRALGALAKETGAAVMPICVFRQDDGSMKVHLEPELPYLMAGETCGEERVLREEWLNAQQYQTAIESMVRLHPEQWLWIHRRWKTRRDPLRTEFAHQENRQENSL